MYGTVAKYQVKPGKEEDMMKWGEDMGALKIDGHVATAVYKADEGNGVYWLAVIFENAEKYRANADSPEQDARYREMREMLAEDPEWHDGEVIARNVS